MPEIQLKTNIVKPLIQIYSLIYVCIACIVISLVIDQDLSLAVGISWFILIIIGYVLTYKKWTQLATIQQAILQQDGQWLLIYSDNKQQVAHLCHNSILTSKLALLQFKIGRFKKEYIFMLRRPENKQAYHALALWWHNER